MFFKPLINDKSGFTDFGALTVLVDDYILLDAGTIISGIKVQDQSKIREIFVTHAHLDHIKDLGFLADNVYDSYSKPIRVWSSKTTLGLIKDHVFNSKIWANFTAIPDRRNPVMTFNELNPAKEYEIGDYKVMGIHVNHAQDSMGFIVSCSKGHVVLTGDSGPTDEIWKRLNSLKGPATVFIETSFPNRFAEVAKTTGHLTPNDLKVELKKITKDDTRIFVCHIKRPYYSEIIEEIGKIEDKRLKVLLQ